MIEQIPNSLVSNFHGQPNVADFEVNNSPFWTSSHVPLQILLTTLLSIILKCRFVVGPEQNCSKIEFLTTSGPIMTVCISRINFQRGRPMSTIFYDSLTQILGFFCVKILIEIPCSYLKSTHFLTHFVLSPGF